MVWIYILKFLFVVLLLDVVLIFKNSNTLKNHNKVSEAIYKYNNYVIHNEKKWEDKLIKYDCMESYNKTLYRLHDWGYQRIVSKAVYEKIKDYL